MTESTAGKAVAIVGVGAVLPDAKNAASFWDNIRAGRYSVGEVPPGRWDPNLYYDADRLAPDKTYSKIGGFVREYDWEPMKWHMPIPPKVGDALDRAQKWSLAASREALLDYGHPERPLDRERTAVIFGNAMAGDMHLLTTARVMFPEYAEELAKTPSFTALPADVRAAVLEELRANIGQRYPHITEDTMPAELGNIVAGRVAAIFDLHGPNYIADAACASALAALNASIEGLEEYHYDVALTGGIDANMSAASYVKFCKIGALSATGTRPYAEGADGFIMGEGAAVFVLKRLADAEKDGDKIYAVIRGVGGSSDGKGKGITAPNPKGQILAVRRAWENAGCPLESATLIEGHGTSTSVGDAVELTCLGEVFGSAGVPAGRIALGSVKSNLGHLKGAAGAAGMLKVAMALRDKQLPPSIGFHKPNPKIDFSRAPFAVNTELRPWEDTSGGVRRAGVSAFGFGGTNFHVVMEEHIPGRLTSEAKRQVGYTGSGGPSGATGAASSASAPKAPLRGALVIGGASDAEIAKRLQSVVRDAEAGRLPKADAPAESDLRATVRLAIDYGSAEELKAKGHKALEALSAGNPAKWKMLRNKGVFRGEGPAPKVAFLYTGQGSQYVNMLEELRERDALVAETFAEADRIMTPLLGRPLSDYIFVDGADEEQRKQAEADLRNTAITQPAVLSVDASLTRLFGEYGIGPDMVMGHSLGEYGALEAAGAFSFSDALEAVSARGREMVNVSVDDNGAMVAVMGPIAEVQRILDGLDGYAVIANLNSHQQVVVGGATATVHAATKAFTDAGMRAIPLSVSHAFHTSIVAPASDPLKVQLQRLGVHPPSIPVVANVTGDFYPMGPGVEAQMVDLLAKQVASPVQFVKGLETLYDAGARIFVEVGPKRALHGFVEAVLGEREGVTALFSNNPKLGDVVSFNQALCGLFAAGLGVGTAKAEFARPAPMAPPPAASAPRRTMGAGTDYAQLGRLFADFIDKAAALTGGGGAVADVPIGVTGVGLGVPGTPRVFDDQNLERVLRGEALIETIPMKFRQSMVDKNVTRLVKTGGGGPRFETISSAADVVKLAGRAGELDLAAQFGVPEDRLPALDVTTRLAFGVGLEAMRDAGLPLIMRYKTTGKGTKLPERWGLPDALRDDTGVIFGSAFPGYDALTEDLGRYYEDKARRQRLAELKHVRGRASGSQDKTLLAELDHLVHELEAECEREPYQFDRRFLFKILSMGHSQFAELIGARGPNTQINAACASGTQAISLAQDWIRAGRCRRVICVSSDDVTSNAMLEWIGAGFLVSGAAATDELVEDAALPFDRRRHGMLLGMGAAGVVVESQASAQERGLAPICEVLGTVTVNSAFHGTRLDVSHIGEKMEELVAGVEAKHGLRRDEMAREMVFMSHETYTPARGGSAQAEIFALRSTFGPEADSIVIANTKGLTGHAMGAGVEDALAIRILETGLVPPVANFKEIDPELGQLNLSKGGAYPVRYALRLAAGFGSQLAMTLMRWEPTADGSRPHPDTLGFTNRVVDQGAWDAWLKQTSGYDRPELEVERRTLRFTDQGPAAKYAKRSEATPVAAPGRAVAAAPAPAPMPAAAVPAPAPAPTPAAATGHSEVEAKVLAIVSEQTGYPPDMLDMDLDLEADLGVDTVKQAETFAAVREVYGIERDEQLKLRDFPTLNHVVKWVLDKRPDLAAAAAAPAATPVAAAPAATAPTAPTGQTSAVEAKVLEIVAEQTGYPPDMLDMDLDLEADLGVDTVKQAETFAAVREVYGIERDETLQLRDFPTLNHVVKWVFDKRPDLAAESAPAAAPAGPTAAATPPAAAATPGAGSEVEAKVLEIVAEQTGYPPDMLDMDLDLEADLGVDTVKQAETFAAVREVYGIERDETLQLRDFPTLKHVVQWVFSKRPDLAGGPATAAAPPAASAADTAASPSGAQNEVEAKVLEIVSEQTGYPSDMLDMDLDLEADLGVDTVKQAETFAAVREVYGIERDETLQLRDFPTLKHVVQWVFDKRPDLAGGAAATPAASAGIAAPPAAAARTAPAMTGDMDAANRVPRRIPVPVLRPPLELCKPTAVELGRGSRVLVMHDRAGVGAALQGQLEKRGVTVLSVSDAPDADELRGRIETWSAEGPIHGVYWLAALDDEGDHQAMEHAAWREALRVRVKLLFTTARALYDALATRGTFLVTATRLGGQHGYGTEGATAPMGGAVVGFTKTFKRERPDTLVKAVDFGDAPTEVVAERLLDETTRDPGIVEVGHADAARWTIDLLERPTATDASAGLALGEDSVFVVTGAAGSIVSAIVSDLAAASRGTFYLLDLTPEPDADSADLARFVSDRDGLKRDLFERIKARGERATPAMVDKELAALERMHAAASAIEAVERAGGTAHYRSANLTDREAIAEVIGEVREAHGRIDVLLHAAGLEISRRLPDKEPREFDLVFDVKADGWFNLVHAIGDMPLGATVAFSSIAGRFGNAGQTDYASANDLLCKVGSSFRARRPDTRGITIDWTAWGGIGMATRGSIPKMMEAAGIGMLAPEAGIPIVRRELTSGAGDHEIVVAEALGVLLEPWDESGGLAPEAIASAGPMTARVLGMHLYEGLVVETELDPDEQPFLHDHEIDGTPVLPGVMGIEAFSEAARVLFPSFRVSAIEDVDFLAPFKFYRGEPRTVRVNATFRKEGRELVADCRLLGRRELKNLAEPQETTHFRARVRLVREPMESNGTADLPPRSETGVVSSADIYKVYFHGPAYQVLERAWKTGSMVAGLMPEALPDNHRPNDAKTVIEPRLIEACFQTAGVFEIGTTGRMGLPQHIDEVSHLRSIDEAKGRLCAVVTATDGGKYDAYVADEAGNVMLRVRGYSTIELPVQLPDDQRKPLREAMS